MSVPTVDKTTVIIDDVIPCAKRLFYKYGYKKTTVDDIASGIRISKKTLYKVFPSKEEILRETVWRDTIEVVRRFDGTIPTGSQSDTMLLSFCRYIFIDRIKQGKDGYFRGLYVDDSHINRATQEAIKRVIKKIYEDGSVKGLFKKIDSDFAGEVILSVIITAVKNFHLLEDPLKIFNDALNVIADAVANKNRIVFETLG